MRIVRETGFRILEISLGGFLLGASNFFENHSSTSSIFSRSDGVALPN